MTFAYVWPDGVVRRIRPGGPAQHVAQLQAHEAEHLELKESAFMMQIVIKDQDDKIKELQDSVETLQSMAKTTSEAIHAVDSLGLAQRISRIAGELELCPQLYLQLMRPTSMWVA